MGDGVLIMVARTLWQAAWLVSELQMRFHRILVLFSLGLFVLAWVPGLAARNSDSLVAASRPLITHGAGGHCDLRAD